MRRVGNPSDHGGRVKSKRISGVNVPSTAVLHARGNERCVRQVRCIFCLAPERFDVFVQVLEQKQVPVVFFFWTPW